MEMKASQQPCLLTTPGVPFRVYHSFKHVGKGIITMKSALKYLKNWRAEFAALAVVFVVAGCYGTIHVRDDQPAEQPTLDMEAVNRGKMAYEEHCADCHGLDARGNGPLADKFDPKPDSLLAPGLHITSTGLESIVDFPHYSSEAIYRRMRHGSEEMPEFKASFTESESRDIIAYIQFLVWKEEKP